MKRILTILAILLIAVTAHAEKPTQSAVIWQQTSDTNIEWYVDAYWPSQLNSEVGAVCMAIPVLEFEGTTPGKRKKIQDFFTKLEKHEDNLTRTKLEAFIQGLPNDIDLHVYFSQDEGKSQRASLMAGNALESRPALEPIPSEDI